MVEDGGYMDIATVANGLGVSVKSIYRMRDNKDPRLDFRQHGPKKGWKVTRASYEAMKRIKREGGSEELRRMEQKERW